MQEETRTMLQRKPLRNFVYYPTVQWPIIGYNMALVLMAVLGTAAAIVGLYAWRFEGTSVYVLSQASFVPLEKISILGVLAPAVIGCVVVSVAVGIMMALSTSRRVALPIYKVTRWARHVADGELHVCLGFRKGDGLEELSQACNLATGNFKNTLLSLKDMAQRQDVPQDVRDRLFELLGDYRIDN